MIVGIITITNQFIHVIPQSYTSPPAGMKGEADNLKVFDGNTKYFKDYLTEESNLNKETDDRINIVLSFTLISSSMFA